jgi:hypothetical protein
MSTRNLPGGKGRLTRKTGNLTAICEPIAYRKCGSLDVSQPYGSSWTVTGITFLFYLALLYIPKIVFFITTGVKTSNSTWARN